MIKQILAFTILTTVLFSCSTSNNVVNNSLFQKRKYNNGWHFKNGSNAKSNGDVSRETTINEVLKTENNVSKEAVKTANIKTVLLSKNNSKKEINKIVLAKTVQSKSGKINKSEATQISDRSESLSQKNKKNSKYLFSQKNEKNNSNGSDDTELILLVILALLIPPLAVFLARGIGTEFWISLILTILFVIPGIIYALLVVFDVV